MNEGNLAHLPPAGNAGAETEDARRDRLASRLRAWLDEHPGATVASIARGRIGFSDGAISSWLGGVYRANPKNINDRVEAFLEKEKTRGAALQNPGVYRTSFFMQSMAAMHQADMMPGRLAVVSADPGQGKSVIARAFAERHPHAQVMLCDVSWRSPHGFARSVLGELTGKRGVRGRADELAREITRTLAAAKPLPFVVFDDAHDLTVDSMNLFTACCERTGASFALVGHPELAAKLRGLEFSRREWWQRIKRRSVFSILPAGAQHPVNEREDIARAILGDAATPEALELLLDVAFCENLGVMCDACHLARLAAEGAGEPVTPEIIRSAVERKNLPARIRKEARR